MSLAQIWWFTETGWNYYISVKQRLFELQNSGIDIYIYNIRTVHKVFKKDHERGNIENKQWSLETTAPRDGRVLFKQMKEVGQYMKTNKHGAMCLNDLLETALFG